MSYRFASKTTFALLALILVGVTAVLVINTPEPSLAAPTTEVENYYVPAEGEPAVVDAQIETAQDA